LNNIIFSKNILLCDSGIIGQFYFLELHQLSGLAKMLKHIQKVYNLLGPPNTSPQQNTCTQQNIYPQPISSSLITNEQQSNPITPTFNTINPESNPETRSETAPVSQPQQLNPKSTIFIPTDDEYVSDSRKVVDLQNSSNKNFPNYFLSGKSNVFPDGVMDHSLIENIADFILLDRNAKRVYEKNNKIAHRIIPVFLSWLTFFYNKFLEIPKGLPLFESSRVIVIESEALYHELLIVLMFYLQRGFFLPTLSLSSTFAHELGENLQYILFIGIFARYYSMLIDSKNIPMSKKKLLKLGIIGYYDMIVEDRAPIFSKDELLFVPLMGANYAASILVNEPKLSVYETIYETKSIFERCQTLQNCMKVPSEIAENFYPCLVNAFKEWLDIEFPKKIDMLLDELSRVSDK
jgi:hypothetical protein